MMLDPSRIAFRAIPHSLLFYFLATFTPVFAAGVTVQTSKGVVEGYAGALASRFVVPYATPPTGDLRFKDPVPAGDFDGVYDASGLPPPCAQNMNELQSYTEDCLFLTIYTPPTFTSSSKLPVFVWVHGGSFEVGASTAPGLDGSKLAAQENIVVVLVQYRLSIIGWMYYPPLGLTGNYGLKDLLLALQYINQEITAFGGDPTSVTLAGQSSGAEMITGLFVTPSATSLFHRAIIHSAPLGYPEMSTTQATTNAEIMLNALGCAEPSLECLASASVEELLDAALTLVMEASAGVSDLGAASSDSIEPFKTVLDGALVTRGFIAATASGEPLEGAGRPIIFTTMKEEGCNAIASLFPDPLPSYYYEPVMEQFFGINAEAVLTSGLYTPDENDGDGVRDTFTLVGTDEPWTCPTQQSAVNITLDSATSVYLGQFDIGISYTNSTVPYCVGKATHEDDIYALFGTHPFPITPSQSSVSAELMSRWGAFVRTGSPNLDGYPTWRKILGASHLNLHIFGNSEPDVGEYRQRVHECRQLWGTVVPYV